METSVARPAHVAALTAGDDSLPCRLLVSKPCRYQNTRSGTLLCDAVLLSCPHRHCEKGRGYGSGWVDMGFMHVTCRKCDGAKMLQHLSAHEMGVRVQGIDGPDRCFCSSEPATPRQSNLRPQQQADHAAPGWLQSCRGWPDNDVSLPRDSCQRQLLKPGQHDGGIASDERVTMELSETSLPTSRVSFHFSDLYRRFARTGITRKDHLMLLYNERCLLVAQCVFSLFCTDA